MLKKSRVYQSKGQRAWRDYVGEPGLVALVLIEMEPVKLVEALAVGLDSIAIDYYRL